LRTISWFVVARHADHVVGVEHQVERGLDRGHQLHVRDRVPLRDAAVGQRRHVDVGAQVEGFTEGR
jgi:hypothetical protein